MANVVLTIQSCPRPGLKPVFTAFNTGDVVMFPNDGQKTLLLVRGATAGTIAVSQSIKQTVDGQAVTPVSTVFTVSGAGIDLFVIPPLPASIYNNPATGQAELTMTIVTVTGAGAAAIQLT